ncbi:MAG: Calx-beta domain-containing protein [Verrucomicrobiota bacterium]
MPNGTLDFCYQTGASIQKSFADAFPEVRSLAPQGGGILVAGNFTAVDGVTRRGIARLRSEPNCSTGTIQFSASVLRFSDDCGNALITIDRSDVGNDSVGVELEAQSLDALGNPSSPLHLPVVFEPGERVKTVELPISLGIAKDGEKSIPLTLRNPTGGAELGAVINALLHIVHAPLLEIISTPDPNFVPFEVEHGFMDSVVVQADGKLLVRGSSVSNEGVGASYLVRLLPDGGLDPSFTVGSHADQYPVALAVTPDNKIILGGGSSAGGGAADAWLVRLDQSGNLDREFHPKLEPQIRLGIAYSTVSQVVVQPDQKVLAMGSFTVTEAGQTERTLARFNPDGSVDRGFAPQLEGLDWGWSMTLLPDGKLMILVSKASAGCSSCYELLRLQSDGALDATFTAAYVNFSPSYQPDGKWLLPGLRATPALDLSPLALRLNADGSLDSSLAWTFDPAGSDIRSAAAQSDMKILLSGFYSSVNGVSRPGLARLHPDGHFDYGFSPKLVDQSPVREGYASRMSFFLPLDDETALAITTTSNDGVTASFSAKLNRYKLVSTNRAATIFISNLRREFKENVTNALVSIVREGDATAAAEARFETIDRSARAGRDYIAQSKTIRFEPGEREKVVPIPLLDNARVDDNRNFTVALSGPAQAVLGTPAQIEVSILDDDHLVEFDSPQYTVDELGRFLLLRVRRYGVATGSFTVDYFTRPVNAAAGVDFTPQSGTIAFGASWFSTNAFIQIPIRDDALVEGDETFQVVLANPSNLVKLGPNAAATVTIRDNDGSFGPGRGVEGIVWALAEQPDETVLVAGQFSSLNGTRRHAIGRLNPDGSLDEHFRGPFAEPDIVTRVAVDSEGRILVVGIFRQMEGRDQQFVRLLQDGNLDHSFAANVEPGFPANTNWFTFPNILAVAAQADGRIVMGGYFTSVNGSNRLGLARLDRNGALDATFSPKAQLQSPNWLGDYVSSIIVQPDNRLLIGGSFRTAEWGARNGLVRLQADGSLDESFTPDLYGGDSLPGEWPNRVRQLALQTDGKILVLREFNQPSLVRLNPDGSRDASFTAQLWPPPFSIGLDAQGKVLVGGYQQMLWLDRNGSPDPTVAPGPLDSGLDFLPVVLSTPFPVTYFPYPTSGVATFCLRRNGRILLGGSFINVQDQTRTGMAELIRDGSLADSLRLYAPVTGSGNLLLRGVAPVGAQIWLEKSSDLVSWTLLDQFQSKDGPFELKDTGPAADGRAFYRLLRK